MLSPFECLCGNFILPEPASYVFFFALFNLRNLLYIILRWVRFAKCARDFLHIFLSNRFLEMPKMGAKKAANLFQDLLLCAMLWWHHLYLVFFMIYLFYTNLDNLNLPANSIASLRGEGEKVIEFSYPSLSYRLLPLLCRICKKKHSCIFVFPDFGQQASNNRRQFLGAQHNQICSLKTTQHFQKEEE